MINNEMKQVQLLSYGSTTDDYGQLRQSTPTSIYIEMMFKIYKQTNTGDMRFVDVEVIGLTKHTAITTSNEIQDGNDIYQVLYVIPSKRYTQVLLRKKH